VKTTVTERRLEDINNIFTEMKESQIEGRTVLSQFWRQVTNSSQTSVMAITL
jgi:hypothetical protein